MMKLRNGKTWKVQREKNIGDTFNIMEWAR